MNLNFLVLNFLRILNDNEDSIKATSEVIQEFFIRQSILFDVFTFGDVLKPIDEILKILNETVEVKKFKCVNKIGINHVFNQSAIIFIENALIADDLQSVARLKNEFPKNLKFLLICDDLIFVSTEKKIFYTIEGRIWQFSFYLNSINSTMQLFTSSWFDEKSCNTPTIFYVNFFDKKKWMKKLENYEKFSNFHRCMIPNFFLNNLVLFYKNEVDGKFQGFLLDIFNMMAQVGNFTPYYQAAELNTKNFTPVRFDEIPQNGKILDSYIQLHTPLFERDNLKYYHFTTAFADAQYIFAITPGE